MRSAGFLHNVKEDIWRQVAGNSGLERKLEMPAFRQPPGISFIVHVIYERGNFGYLLENPVQNFRRRGANNIDIDGEPANDRNMEQETGAPLEDKFQTAFRQMPEEGEGMQRPFQQNRIDIPQLFPFFLKPVGSKANFRDHVFNPLTPHFSKMRI